MVMVCSLGHGAGLDSVYIPGGVKSWWGSGGVGWCGLGGSGGSGGLDGGCLLL